MPPASHRAVVDSQVDHPHGQRCLARRRRTLTTVPSGLKITPTTQAPGMANIRLNAVVTCTCPPR